MLGMGGWPALERWFAAMDSRATYAGMKSDFYTHCHDLPPQLGGCAFNQDGPAVAAQIDGTKAQLAYVHTYTTAFEGVSNTAALVLPLYRYGRQELAPSAASAERDVAGAADDGGDPAQGSAGGGGEDGV